MGERRDPRQDAWDAGQREHDALVARQSEAQPESEWVTLPGLHGWVRRQDAD
jgi:hypothetical protein